MANQKLLSVVSIIFAFVLIVSGIINIITEPHWAGLLGKIWWGYIMVGLGLFVLAVRMKWIK